MTEPGAPPEPITRRDEKMAEERVLKAMRSMAWERAKGELEAALCTFWGEMDPHGDFDKAEKAVRNFIKRVEDDGLFQ